MISDQAKPPRGLGVHGRRLWRSVAEQMASDGLELTASDRHWLHSTATLTDQAAALEAALKGAPLYMTDSMGQQVANPLISEMRQLHLAASLTLSRIKVSADDEAARPVLGVVSNAVHGRKGANVRWRGRGA